MPGRSNWNFRKQKFLWFSKGSLSLLYFHIRNPLCLFIESKLAKRFAKTAVMRQKSPPEAPKNQITKIAISSAWMHTHENSVRGNNKSSHWTSNNSTIVKQQHSYTFNAWYFEFIVVFTRMIFYKITWVM